MTPPSLPLGPGTSCLAATVSPNPGQFTVSFDVPCVVGSTDVTMTVAAMGTASPGNYVVTVRETELSVGGNLIGSYQWPFVVLGAPSTTSSTTTTTVPATTTTTSATSTTTSTPYGSTSTTLVSTTTSTLYVVTPTTTDRAGSTNTSTPGGPGSTGGGNGAHKDPDVGPQTATGVTGEPKDQPVGLKNIAFSESLRSNLGALPEPVGDLALSPLVIAEILFRAMAENLFGFLVPLLLATVIVLIVVRRQRKGVADGDADLSHQDAL